MAKQIINVPEMGGAENVEIIEIYVSVGDDLEKEQAIIALESDKASMDIPSPISGKITDLKVKVGDSVSAGDPLIELDSVDTESESTEKTAETAKQAEMPELDPEKEAERKEPTAEESATSETPKKAETLKKAEKKSAAPAKQTVNVPDMGGAENVEIIEIYVSVGDDLEKEQAIIALESDKASMDIPSPISGKITDLKVKVGDSVSAGDPLIEVEAIDAESESTKTETDLTNTPEVPEKLATTEQSEKPESPEETEKIVEQATVPGVKPPSDIYAGPAVRKFAREVSVDLNQVTGTGLRSRITKSNVKDHIKAVMTGRSAASSPLGNAGIPPTPAVDFASFGKVDIQVMSKIKKLTAANMSRNWLTIPHVTQFDDADITDLDIFRKELKAEAEQRGVKLTLMPFILKACAAALRSEPAFNASINAEGTHIVYKDYVHIGVAVDTSAGLMVPVLRDVDKKGLWQLTEEFGEIAQKARDGKLVPADMKGGCFTLSSLGSIGGKGFTPIVNAPEVAILGISKSSVKPFWNGSEFVPRQMLPLSLSYDHRAVNGADAGRFFTYLTAMIADVRRLLL